MTAPPPSRPPVLISAGTRPEIIKMAPLHAALRRAGLPVGWVHTGQHADAQGLYRFFGIVPDHTLTLARHDPGLAHLHARLLEALAALYDTLRPAAVLVHGDTTSTLASAQAAFYSNVPVGHVEAGLRTRQPREPFPEEMNRALTARLARWHFAPTAGAVAHLLREGIAPQAVHLVGNSAVDAVRDGCARLDALLAQPGAQLSPPAIDAWRVAGAGPSAGPASPAGLEQGGPAGTPPVRLLTVTAHRRENWGGGIEDIARAVARLLASHADLAVAWPLHGNPAVGRAVQRVLGPLAAPLQGRLLLCPPLDYPALLWCLRRSVLVLTDSGGIQEECAALATPVLVLRRHTERPELIDAGGGRLVGTAADGLVATVTALLADAPALARMRAAVNPFGDGHTAERVVAVLGRELVA